MSLPVRLAVVVPAFNEADRIASTIRSIPGFVDHVIVVDDGSQDGTATNAREAIASPDAPSRVEVVVHPRNRGVGAAIATGYARALARGADVIAVMAGDGQMDPDDLPNLLRPVIEGAADYAKGNRLAWPGGWREFPLVRLGGSLALSWLTRLATGYRGLSDSQCGYTAASRAALEAVGPGRMYPRYGYPNHLLALLADAGARVADIPVRPVYGAGWRSGLHPVRVVVPVSRILVRAFRERLARRGRPAPPLLEQRGRCGSAC